MGSFVFKSFGTRESLVAEDMKCLAKGVCGNSSLSSLSTHLFSMSPFSYLSRLAFLSTGHIGMILCSICSYVSHAHYHIMHIFPAGLESRSSQFPLDTKRWVAQQRGEGWLGSSRASHGSEAVAPEQHHPHQPPTPASPSSGRCRGIGLRSILEIVHQPGHRRYGWTGDRPQEPGEAKGV